MQATGGAALTPPERSDPERSDPERSDPERSDPERSDRPEQAPRPWARPVAAGLLAAIGAAAVLADLLTKQLTVALLEGAEPVRLLGGAVYLVHATNSGAAFSIGGSYTPFFATIAIVVIGWIGWMALRLRSLPWAVALGLVLGGAAGNLVDRLFRPPGPWRGEVVDMVSLFDPYGQVWPVFNLADSALFAGVALAVWLELTGRRRDGTRVSSTRRGVRPAGRAG